MFIRISDFETLSFHTCCVNFDLDLKSLIFRRFPVNLCVRMLSVHTVDVVAKHFVAKSRLFEKATFHIYAFHNDSNKTSSL